MNNSRNRIIVFQILDWKYKRIETDVHIKFFFIVDALFYVANANITNLRGRCYMKIMSTHKLN